MSAFLQCHQELLGDSTGQIYCSICDGVVATFLRWPLSSGTAQIQMQKSLIDVTFHPHVLVSSLGLAAWSAMLKHGCLRTCDPLTPALWPDPQQQQTTHRLSEYQLTWLFERIQSELPATSKKTVLCHQPNTAILMGCTDELKVTVLCSSPPRR